MGKSRRPRSTQAQRDAWLRAHPIYRNASKKRIVYGMKAAGLISPTTYYLDVRLPWERISAHPELAAPRRRDAAR